MAKKKPEKAWNIVTRQMLASLLGVHPDTVSDFVAGGMPILARGGHGKEGSYDAIACLDWQRQQLGKNAKDAAQTRALTASAELNELKLERERQELFPRDQLVREGQAFVKAWQAMLRRLPRRLLNAGLITRVQEPAAAAVVRDVLEESARWRTQADLRRPLKVQRAP